MKPRLETTVFGLLHLGAIGAGFTTPARPWTGVVAFLIYGFCVGGGYHRLFAHRSFEMTAVVSSVVAWLGTAVLMRGPLWWVSHHRRHHRVADSPLDLGSPHVVGFRIAYFGGGDLSVRSNILREEVPDLSSDRYLEFLERYRYLPAVSVILISYALGGWPALLWAYALPATAVLHGLCWINSVSHLYGWRTHGTPDRSTNSLIVSIFTLGEGWHNNHHAHPARVKFGRGLTQPDPVYWMIRALSAVRLARTPRESGS